LKIEIFLLLIQTVPFFFQNHKIDTHTIQQPAPIIAMAPFERVSHGEKSKNHRNKKKIKKFKKFKKKKKNLGGMASRYDEADHPLAEPAVSPRSQSKASNVIVREPAAHPANLPRKTSKPPGLAPR
jgi:hypothetical protein